MERGRGRSPEPLMLLAFVLAIQYYCCVSKVCCVLYYICWYGTCGLMDHRTVLARILGPSTVIIVVTHFLGSFLELLER